MEKSQWEKWHGTPDEQHAVLVAWGCYESSGKSREVMTGTVAECRGWINSHNLNPEDYVICRLATAN